MTDAERETEIAFALAAWHAADCPTKARAAYNKFRTLVARRSPQKVRELEIEKGIATVQEG